MLSQAEALYALQKIDLQLLKNHKRLEAIVAELEDNAQVRSAKSEVEKATAQLTPLRVKARDLELELQTTQQKYRASEDRLYSGTVKNPKELQDLQNEIASLKQRIDHLEEILLETMMQVEDATEILTQTESHLQTVSQTVAQQNRALADEQKELQSQTEKLSSQRGVTLKGITPDSLKTYQTLRPKKANQPVAVMRNCSCTVCGIEQTKAIEENVRKGNALITCLSCGRILVEML